MHLSKVSKVSLCWYRLFYRIKVYCKDLEKGWKRPKNDEGKPHGRGKCVYSKGDVFEGEYKDRNMNRGYSTGMRRAVFTRVRT